MGTKVKRCELSTCGSPPATGVAHVVDSFGISNGGEGLHLCDFNNPLHVEHMNHARWSWHPYTSNKDAGLLPTDPKARKDLPITTGVLDYFPRAIAYVSSVSKKGNDQHNPGEPLHWDRTKSTDHANCIGRHLIERGTIDPIDGVRHSGKLAWRALANLEIELETAEKEPGQK